ncbi:cytochrome P450 [Chaetomidium leptoderma]|uniref:Cytochrome P450 n=1 Tax=Chaetomidium leptoderma TaxID=669021 RepID=A0AAN6ZWI8_9PEZI|nr:cytochrome P450 [Chaetomidium leptoderma]
MSFAVLAAIGAAVAVAIYTCVSGLQRNIAKARKTGLVYIVVRIPWMLTFWIWVPLIKLLPESLWAGWLFVMIPEWGHSTGQEHFDRMGTETFLVASPGTLMLYTQHAEVIHRVTQRRETFPKDIAQYGVLEMFGRNVLTTEGALWRLHRKVTSASFNEKNAAHTFAEAINQTRGMLDMWFGQDGERAGTTKTIRTIEHDTMTWALNIIGYVGFGLRLLWPGQTLPKDIDPKLARYGSLEAPPGHTLTFADSVALTLERIVAIMLYNETILRFLPFKFAREAYQAKTNYVQYMNEFLNDKVEETRAGGAPREGMDIMGQLVQSKYGEKASSKKDTNTNTNTNNAFKLDDSDIIGNAFIMIVAGHETTANTLHFSLVELANNPAAQRRLQQDVDAVLGPDTDPATWDYDKHINALLASHVGACVNETLRLLPPVTGIPKVVTPDAEQTITVDGRTHVLPAGLSCTLLAGCVQRNPRWWPTRPSERDPGKATDLDDYLPERWYRSSSSKGEEQEQDAAGIEEDDKGDYGGFQGSDVSASLYRPVRGSYLPFSDGPRSCLGRRIAMVEMGAALAVIFQRYTVELAVDEWATDAEVERMGAAQRREVYRKAQDKSRDILRQADSVLTLKLHGGKHVPVRLVKRGRESYEGYRKSELELAIDEHLSDNVSRYQQDSRFQDYFKSRARAGGSPIKKEALAAPELKVSRRRAPKPVEEIVAAETEEEAEEEEEDSSSNNNTETTSLPTLAAEAASATSTALARTPGRAALALASRIQQLPATPADVAHAVDRSTVAVRARVASLYQESGLSEATQTTREWLSTVHSVVSAIALFELYKLRQEVLPDRYAFTIPAVGFLGSPDYPVHLPDMFALVTAAFWGPALTWAVTSVVLPSLVGYFFNLSSGAAAHHQQTVKGRRGGRQEQVEYAVDPVMFSIVKAIVTYVVYAQGVTFCGAINPESVSRINSALYSGWKGVLVGTAVSGLTAVYDAVLRK